jgi:hypothetical protein
MAIGVRPAMVASLMYVSDGQLLPPLRPMGLGCSLTALVLVERQISKSIGDVMEKPPRWRYFARRLVSGTVLAGFPHCAAPALTAATERAVSVTFDGAGCNPFSACPFVPPFPDDVVQP